MRISTAALAGLVAGALAACKSAPAPITDADRAAVRDMNAAFVTAVNANNVDGMMAGYAADAIVMPPNMPVAAGSAAVRELWTSLQAAGRVRLELHQGTYDGAGDIMYATGAYHLQPVPADTTHGMPPAEDGKYILVLRKQADGSWKVVRDMWSANAMPAMPAPAATPARRR